MSQFLRSFAFVCGLLALPGGEALALQKGESMPAFARPGLSHGKMLNSEYFRGKVLYLDFWASWCGPCKQSLPMLDQMRSDLVAGGYPGLFEIVAVNLDENPEAARRFLKRYPVSYPVISDPEASLATVYKIPTMPTSFIINPQGVVTWRHEGFRPSEISEIRKQLVQTMNGQP